MSLYDYQQGLSQGNAESLVAIRDRNAAISRANEWKDYCNKLQSELQKVEMEFAKAEAGRIGFAHLFRVVKEELRRIDPNNPLLQKESQLRILGAKIAEKAAELGYDYNLETETFKPKEL